MRGGISDAPFTLNLAFLAAVAQLFVRRFASYDKTELQAAIRRHSRYRSIIL